MSGNVVLLIVNGIALIILSIRHIKLIRENKELRNADSVFRKQYVPPSIISTNARTSDYVGVKIKYFDCKDINKHGPQSISEAVIEYSSNGKYVKIPVPKEGFNSAVLHEFYGNEWVPAYSVMAMVNHDGTINFVMNFK